MQPRRRVITSLVAHTQIAGQLTVSELPLDFGTGQGRAFVLMLASTYRQRESGELNSV